MSNTNLPPNIEASLSNTASRFNDLSSELGSQIKLSRRFNKEVGGFLDNLKKANEVFGNVVAPLESLKKSIDALAKVVQANTKTTYYSLSRAFRTSRAGARLRDTMSDAGLPPGPPQNPNNNDPDDNSPREPFFKPFLERFNRIGEDQINSIKTLVASNQRYFSITDNLIKAYKDFEALNEKSLAMGVSYERFFNANSAELRSSRVSMQELAEVMVSNFGAGIRMNSKELQDLNEEMIATGQDTQALQSVNANLLALTGKNADVVSNLAKVNQDVSKEYQISNDRLVRTMQSLAENFEQASFFGSDAVEAVGTLGQELQGLIGVDMPQELNTAVSLLIPSMENIGRRQLLGLEGIEEKFVNNNVVLADLAPAFQRVLRVRDRARQTDLDTANLVAASQFQVSEQQFRQLSRLAEAVINGNEFQSEIAQKRDEEFKQVQVLRKKQLDYFTEVGPQTYEAVRTITPAITQLTLAMNLAAGAGSLGNIGGAKFSFKGGNFGLGAMGKRALGGTAIGAATTGLRYLDDPNSVSLGSAAGSIGGAAIGQAILPIPVVGALIGGYIGNAIGEYFDPLEDVKDSSKKTAEETAKANREAEKERREKEAASRQEMSALASLGAYLRRMAPKEGQSEALKEAIEENTKEMKKYRAATASKAKSSPSPESR
tara:strand:+ start:1118 stop:3100 length:1983 start_codon:yes stop_codon:yes gene_type:complete